MTISRVFYKNTGAASGLTELNRTMQALQTQMYSGKLHETLSDLKSHVKADSYIRGQLSRVVQYKNNMKHGNLRLTMTSNSVERMLKIKEEIRTSALPAALGLEPANIGGAKTLATTHLKETIGLLNSEVSGQFIFGGNVTSQQPVAAFDEMMFGGNNKAGFNTVVAERIAADSANGGRLDQSVVGASLTLSEDGAHPFGFKLNMVEMNPTIGTGTLTTGGAQSLDITITDNAAITDGAQISIGVTLPNDRTTVRYITLTATFSPTFGENDFRIGADANETMDNIGQALSAAIGKLHDGALYASSSFAAADSFFSQDGSGVMRTAGGPPATSLVSDSGYGSTVQWYRGQISNDIRGSVTLNMADNVSLNHGSGANEDGFVGLLKSLAVLATSSFTASDANAAARFSAIATTQTEVLSADRAKYAGSIENFAKEIAIGQGNIKALEIRNIQQVGQLEEMLADIEDVSMEEVAVKMLAMQNRMQASYEVTAMLSQLSLVNYMR